MPRRRPSRSASTTSQRRRLLLLQPPRRRKPLQPPKLHPRPPPPRGQPSRRTPAWTMTGLQTPTSSSRWHRRSHAARPPRKGRQGRNPQPPLQPRMTSSWTSLGLPSVDHQPGWPVRRLVQRPHPDPPRRSRPRTFRRRISAPGWARSRRSSGSRGSTTQATWPSSKKPSGRIRRRALMASRSRLRRSSRTRRWSRPRRSSSRRR